MLRHVIFLLLTSTFQIGFSQTQDIGILARLNQGWLNSYVSKDAVKWFAVSAHVTLLNME